MQSHFPRGFARAATLAFATAIAPAWAQTIEVEPRFPVYGDVVTAELRDAGPAPYIPATRLRRDGGIIAMEMEHMAGGFFGPRSDMLDLPVSLGELVPGHYTLQARIYDIANPDAPPRLATRGIDVAPPDAPGVYSIPRKPPALGSFDLLLRADGPIDPSSLRVTMDGWTVRMTFSHSFDPSAPTFASIKMKGLPPGAFNVEAVGSYPSVMAPGRRYAGGFEVGSTTTVVEYYGQKLDHYFITAWPDEIDQLDEDAGASFKRTGERFKAWLRASDAPAYAVPVCRFYASGPNSHFYTADPGECQFLKNLEQKERSVTPKGQSLSGWQFEAIAFYALAPQGGACPSGSTPVYRAFNKRAAEGDSNHRFTVTATMRDAMKTTWADEGVAFCAPAS